MEVFCAYLSYSVKEVVPQSVFMSDEFYEGGGSFTLGLVMIVVH